MKDQNLLSGHLQDLAERSYQNNMYTFTHFLGEAELDTLMRMSRSLSYAGLKLFGGTEHASRLMARFGKEEELGYDQDFPISCLKIEPLLIKFGEELSHRDYLGALMSLGVERELLGDIYIDGKTAYVFCTDHISSYIMEHLTQIRHTSVKTSLLEEIPSAAGPRLKEQIIIAASNRLDAIISGVYNLSRSRSLQLFPSGKVFVGGKECSNNSAELKSGDTVSVRGFGKFIYAETLGSTGKGRSRIRVQIYC